MGATLSTESVLTVTVVAGALGIGYHQYNSESTPVTKVPKKKKKKKGPEDKHSTPAPSQSTPLVDSSSAIPGQFHDPITSASSKVKNSTKRKHTPRTNPPPPPPPLESSVQQEFATSSIDTDGSWTRVKSRRRLVEQGSEQTTNDVTTTSDAGITSSVTENSSPVDEEEEEEELSDNSPQQTLAEMLVPKAPKTAVDDMLPQQPTLSRVMRIQPLPNEKPLPGFSWEDYEDVQVADGGGDDADGEDDGWGVVQSKRSRAPKREPSAVAQQQQQQHPVETLTRKQRQNAKKRETQKAVKAATEAERVATLANHKRELERVRMMEQSRSSRGMKPVVDDRGKLVWE